MGAILFEALSGQPAFTGPSSPRAPELPALEHRYPAALRATISRALEPGSLRHTDASELLDDLERGLGARQLDTKSDSSSSLAQRWRLHERLLPALGLSGVAVALVLGFWSLTRSPDAVWLEDEGLPRLGELIERGELDQAAQLFEQARARAPRSRRLDAMKPRIYFSVILTSDPAKATVLARPAPSPGSTSAPTWSVVGTTPMRAELPRRPHELRFELGSHVASETLVTPGPATDSAPVELHVELEPEGNGPD